MLLLGKSGTEGTNGSVPLKKLVPFSLMGWHIQFFSCLVSIEWAELSRHAVPFSSKIQFCSIPFCLLGQHIQFRRCLATLTKPLLCNFKNHWTYELSTTKLTRLNWEKIRQLNWPDTGLELCGVFVSAVHGVVVVDDHGAVAGNLDDCVNPRQGLELSNRHQSFPDPVLLRLYHM